MSVRYIILFDRVPSVHNVLHSALTYVRLVDKHLLDDLLYFSIKKFERFKFLRYCQLIVNHVGVLFLKCFLFSFNPSSDLSHGIHSSFGIIDFLFLIQCLSINT